MIAKTGTKASAIIRLLIYRQGLQALGPAGQPGKEKRERGSF